MTRTLIAAIFSAALLISCVAAAEEPVLNVSPKIHPNLAAAQRLSRQAFQKIVAAQKSNEYDMDGHAQKAKELLDQVNEELKLAAQAANKHRSE